MKPIARCVIQLTLVFAALSSLTQTAQAALWVTNSPMTTPRSSHTATLLSNGKVLVTGGVTNGVERASTAELYDPANGSWTPTGSMIEPRAGHTAVLLSNGKVLVTGGTFSAWPNGSYGSSAELYDPATGEWTLTGNMSDGRAFHTTTMLPDGQVLVTGGQACKPCLTPHASAELYDAVSGTWSNATSLNYAHSGHTSTLLPNGKVLIVGGGRATTNIFLDFSHIVEQFDPANGSWSVAHSLNQGRSEHTSTLLPNGKVLVTGGANGAGSNALSDTEQYDLVTGTWTTTNAMITARYVHAATLLPNGKLLVTGGLGTNNIALSSTEFYDPITGSWTTNSTLIIARYNHTATLLPNGKVLVIGGGDTNFVPLSSTELYDSANGSWTNTGAMNTARNWHTTTLLPNGQVLISGGQPGEGTNPLPSTELYDPVSETWTTTGEQANARFVHTTTLLPDGSVLNAGGSGSVNDPPTAELYNPSTGTWSATGTLNIPRHWHTATLLLNGKVLIAGGVGDGLMPATAELYNPTTGVWTPTGSLNTPRLCHTATLLPNGKVLVTAGRINGYGDIGDDSELYDTATETWVVAGSLQTARQFHTATLLPNGKVLVTGGQGNDITSIATCELYDAGSGTWTPTGTLNQERYQHTATLLPNGKIMVAGGYDHNFNIVPSVEIYDPAVGSWASSGAMSTGRIQHTATLSPNGKVLIAGGGALFSAELYDVDLGFNTSWQPQITPLTPPLNLGNGLAINGSRFRGISGASGGSTQDSSSDYPLVQLRSIESGQTLFLQTTNWSASSFISLPVWNFPPGWAMATVFVNGIPTTSSIVNITVPVPTPPTITDAKQLTNGTVQFSFTNSVGSVFGTLASTNASLPLSNWTMLSGIVEISPGQFQFTDPQATNSPQRFYRVRAN